VLSRGAPPLVAPLRRLLLPLLSVLSRGVPPLVAPLRCLLPPLLSVLDQLPVPPKPGWQHLDLRYHPRAGETDPALPAALVIAVVVTVAEVVMRARDHHVAVEAAVENEPDAILVVRVPVRDASMVIVVVVLDAAEQGEREQGEAQDRTDRDSRKW
jgi:hypothetical protein